MTARRYADVTISIDCDGQDDINAMDEMIDHYHKGMDIVYGVRSKRDTDTWFKRTTAESFYKLMNALGAQTVYNHADYRLMSRRALDGLAQFHEVNLFLRGLVPLVGYPSSIVTYERAERMAGESHYPLKKMLSFAFDGITSLSVKPIRLITHAGLSHQLYQRSCHFVGICNKVFRPNGFRLVQHGVCHLFHGRCAAFMFGRHWGVYRKNFTTKPRRVPAF